MTRKNIWRIIASNPKHDQNRAVDWIRQNWCIFVGWGNIGDLRKERYSSAAEIRTVIKEHYPHANWSKLIDGGASLWNILEMETGDWVIVSTNRHREFVVKITGPYEHVDGPPNLAPYCHQRTVQIIDDEDPENLWVKAGGPAAGQNIRWTLFRCKNQM